MRLLASRLDGLISYVRLMTRLSSWVGYVAFILAFLAGDGGADPVVAVRPTAEADGFQSEVSTHAVEGLAAAYASVASLK